MYHENLNVYNYIISGSDSSSSLLVNLLLTLKLIFGNSVNAILITIIFVPNPSAFYFF